MSFSVAEICGWVGGRVANAEAFAGKLDAVRAEKLSALGVSAPGDGAFFFAKEYQPELLSARASVVITGEPFVAPLAASGLPLWKSAAFVACRDPYWAMAVISEKFAGKLSSVAHLSAPVPNVHPTALVHPSAELGAGVHIGPYCVIREGARIGARTVLYPSCFVDQGVKIGADGVLFHSVTVYEWTEIGDRVRVHAGARIGSDGFGYAPKMPEKPGAGGVPESLQKIYHLGRVVIGNDVEIGANCTIDRATFGETKLGNSVKIDNLVHVGHNAELGEGTVVAGGTCFAGRAKTGRFVQIGGLTGIANGVMVNDGAKVGALALLTKDVAPGATAVGNPQREYSEHFRAHATLNKLMKKKPKA